MSSAEHGSNELTLIIVAYHRPRFLAAHLSALELTGHSGISALELTGHSGIRVVVVNVEDDAEVAQVAEAAGARVVSVSTNPGYAACVNLGAGASDTDVVIFANDDILSTTPTLHALANVVTSGKAAVAVPRVIDGSGRAVLTCQAVPDLRNFLLEWVILPDRPIPLLSGAIRVEKWRQPTVQELVPAASAVLVATRRSLLLDVPLPEAYFMYFEESEWFWQLARRGERTVFCPEVSVTHYGGRSVATPSKYAQQARNAVRFARRTSGSRTVPLAYVLTIAWQLRLLATSVARYLSRRTTGEMVGARVSGLRAALASWRQP